MWHLRIHCDHYGSTDLYQYLNTICSVVLCVFEQHDNRPHIHMVFNEGGITKSRVVQKMLERFPLLKGNGAYSCSHVEKMKKKKVGDAEKALAYLCKGIDKDTLPVVVGKTEIDVAMYHERYWQVNEMIKEEVNMGCQNDSSSDVKKKPKDWSSRTYAYMETYLKDDIDVIRNHQLLYRVNDSEKKAYENAQRNIFRCMMKCLGQAVKKLSPRIIEELYQGFMNAICQNSENLEIGDAYSDKIFNSLILRN